MKKYTDKDLEQKQIKLDSKKSTLSLRSKNGKELTPNDIVDVAKQFFNLTFSFFSSVIVNKKTKKIKWQETGEKRSIEDFYLTCKTFYPKITYKECYDFIEQCYENSILGRNWCFVIKKRIHYPRYRFNEMRKILGTSVYNIKFKDNTEG